MSNTHLTNDEKDMADNYVLDVKNTLIANSTFFGFLGVTYIIIMRFVLLISSLQGDHQLLALLVFMFVLVKILSMTRAPSLEYKQRVMKP